MTWTWKRQVSCGAMIYGGGGHSPIGSRQRRDKGNWKNMIICNDACSQGCIDGRQDSSIEWSGVNHDSLLLRVDFAAFAINDIRKEGWLKLRKIILSIVTKVNWLSHLAHSSVVTVVLGKVSSSLNPVTGTVLSRTVVIILSKMSLHSS